MPTPAPEGPGGPVPPSPADRVRIAVLISGTGSNMAALIDASTAGGPFEVVLVVSNRPDAGGLAIARSRGVSVAVIDHRPFDGDREAHERAMDAVLAEHRVEVVALAGYMRLLTPWLVQRWQGRLLNIHPSLLPKYPGLNTHARAIEAGDPEAGCSVHLVTEGVDEGPVLARATVPVLTDDTPASLAQRVLTAEHELYAQALADFCSTQMRSL